MNRFLRLLRQPVVYRTAIGLYVLLVLTLAGAAFAIYSVRVDGSMYVRGETALEKERDHGIQGRFFHAPTRTSILPETMEWTLESAEGADSYPLQISEESAADSWPNFRFRVSDDVPEGDYELRVHATHEYVDEMVATREVTVTSRPQPAPTLTELPWNEEWIPRVDDPDERATPLRHLGDDDRGRVELVMAPSDGELVRGVPGTVVFRTFDPDTGEPVPSTVELEWIEGSGRGDFEERFETNALGLAIVEFYTGSAINALQYEATVTPLHTEEAREEEEEEEEEAEEREEIREHFRVSLLPVVTRYGVEPLAPVVTPGEPIQAVVRSTLNNQEFMADLHDVEGRRFLDGVMVAMSDGEAGVIFTAPEREASSPLLHIQIYQSLYGTTHGWDDAYVLLLEDDGQEALRQAAMDLYSWIAEESDSVHHRRLVEEEAFDGLSRRELLDVIDAGLREIPRSFQLPEEILNTRDQDRRALEEWREEAQSDLRVMMALTLLVGLIVVVYLILLGIRRTQRENALIRELAIELEEDAPDVEAMERGARIERAAVVLQAVIVFCTLVVFGVGIFFILSYL